MDVENGVRTEDVWLQVSKWAIFHWTMIMGGKGMDSGNWKSKRSSYLQMIHHNFPICFFFFSGRIWQAKSMQKWGWRRNKRLLSTLSVSIKLKHIDVFVYFHEPSACTFWPLPPKKLPILQTFWPFRCKLFVMFINRFQTLEPATSNHQSSTPNARVYILCLMCIFGNFTTSLAEARIHGFHLG